MSIKKKPLIHILRKRLSKIRLLAKFNLSPHLDSEFQSKKLTLISLLKRANKDPNLKQKSFDEVLAYSSYTSRIIDLLNNNDLDPIIISNTQKEVLDSLGFLILRIKQRIDLKY